MWYHNTVPSIFQDDLPAVSISRLRAAGVVTPDMARVEIAFGKGDDVLRRVVGLWHRRFSNTGGWSLFVCPNCSRRARVLRLNGKPMCRRCLLREGVPYRIAGGSPAERAEARVKRIERLRKLLEGGPARLHGRPGRGLDRRGALEMSLRRAQIAARQDLLGQSSTKRGEVGQQ